MRVRFKRAWEEFGSGLLADVDDERAKAAVAEDAAEEMHLSRLTKDFNHGGQTFAANLEYSLTDDQLKAARKAGAVPEADAEPTGGRKRHKGASHGAEE